MTKQIEDLRTKCLQRSEKLSLVVSISITCLTNVVVSITLSHSLHYSILLCSEGRGNHSATSNNMKLVHWPLMGGLLHLVQ